MQYYYDDDDEEEEEEKALIKQLQTHSQKLIIYVHSTILYK